MATTALAMGIAGCGSAPQVTPTAIDVEGEQDVLFACALDIIEQGGYALAVRSDARRLAVTTWVADGLTRRRISASVLLHPQFGPAIHTARVTNVWIGAADELDVQQPMLAEAPEEGEVGWLTQAPTDDDRAFERSFADATERCWRVRREALYEPQATNEPRAH